MGENCHKLKRAQEKSPIPGLKDKVRGNQPRK